MTEKNSAVIIGCDHAAYTLKETIKGFLNDWGEKMVDVGAYGPTSVDYPDYGIKVAQAISSGTHGRGILLCGTGIGMSIVANKFGGVRAALCHSSYEAAMSRLHNDSNILVLGGRVIGSGLAREIVKVWMNTPFEGGRHSNRIKKFEKFGWFPQ